MHRQEERLSEWTDGLLPWVPSLPVWSKVSTLMRHMGQVNPVLFMVWVYGMGVYVD